MPRKAAVPRVKEKKIKMIVTNKVVEKADWRARVKKVECNCFLKDNGKACEVGCEMRQQRTECVGGKDGGCVHGVACANRIFQRRDFKEWKIIQCGERGEGLALKEAAKENEVVLEYTGELMTMETAVQRLELNRGLPTYTCEVVKGWAIDARHMGSGARWINSSHAPNCVLETWWLRSTLHMGIRLLRDVEAGEELTFEYGFVDGQREPCLCGAGGCSGFIGSRVRGSRLPPDPSTWNEPVTAMLTSVSRSCRSALREYGMRATSVRGDGHCLFHSFSVLHPGRTHLEWRRAIADDISLITEPEQRDLYVARANNDIRDGRSPFADFDELIAGIRGKEWGNADCIRHFSKISGRSVIVFTQGSDPVYYRWQWDQAPVECVFMYNSRCATTLRLVHFDPCQHVDGVSQKIADLLARMQTIHDVRPDAHESDSDREEMWGRPADGFGGDHHDGGESMDVVSHGMGLEEEGVVETETGPTSVEATLEGTGYRSRVQHATLTDHLSSLQLSSSRVAFNHHSFFASLSATPAHTFSGVSIPEIRLRISRIIQIEWSEASEDGRIVLREAMGMDVEDYVAILVGHGKEDDLIKKTASRMMGGSLVIWSPGNNFDTPTCWIDRHAQVGVVVNLQWVNVNREGELNHFEPVFRNEDAWKGRKRKQQKDAGEGKKSRLKRATGLGLATSSQVCPIESAEQQTRSGASGSGGRKLTTWPNPTAPEFVTRIPFVDKKEPRAPVAARAHWGLYYFVFRMQERNNGEWDLHSLASMALHPKISKEAAQSIWELGWQESIGGDDVPTAGCDFDTAGPWEGMKLWIASHMWASDCEEGGRADLVMCLANIGPVGIWPSLGSTVREMAEQRPGSILLGDLKISKRSVASLRSSLSFQYPQYQAVISSHSAAEWEEGVRRKYHYAIATLLHRHLYTGVCCETIHNPRDKAETRVVLGHAHVVTAVSKTLGTKVMFTNLYQHTALHTDRQELVWKLTLFYAL